MTEPTAASLPPPLSDVAAADNSLQSTATAGFNDTLAVAEQQTSQALPPAPGGSTSGTSTQAANAVLAECDTPAFTPENRDSRAYAGAYFARPELGDNLPQQVLVFPSNECGFLAVGQPGTTPTILGGSSLAEAQNAARQRVSDGVLSGAPLDAAYLTPPAITNDAAESDQQPSQVESDGEDSRSAAQIISDKAARAFAAPGAIASNLASGVANWGRGLVSAENWASAGRDVVSDPARAGADIIGGIGEVGHDLGAGAAKLLWVGTVGTVGEVARVGASVIDEGIRAVTGEYAIDVDKNWGSGANGWGVAADWFDNGLPTSGFEEGRFVIGDDRLTAGSNQIKDWFSEEGARVMGIRNGSDAAGGETSRIYTATHNAATIASLVGGVASAVKVVSGLRAASGATAVSLSDEAANLANASDDLGTASTSATTAAAPGTAATPPPAVQPSGGPIHNLRQTLAAKNESVVQQRLASGQAEPALTQRLKSLQAAIDENTSVVETGRFHRTLQQKANFEALLQNMDSPPAGPISRAVEKIGTSISNNGTVQAIRSFGDDLAGINTELVKGATNWLTDPSRAPFTTALKSTYDVVGAGVHNLAVRSMPVTVPLGNTLKAAGQWITGTTTAGLGVGAATGNIRVIEFTTPVSKDIKLEDPIAERLRYMQNIRQNIDTKALVATTGDPNGPIAALMVGGGGGFYQFPAALLPGQLGSPLRTTPKADGFNAVGDAPFQGPTVLFGFHIGTDNLRASFNGTIVAARTGWPFVGAQDVADKAGGRNGNVSVGVQTGPLTGVLLTDIAVGPAKGTFGYIATAGSGMASLGTNGANVSASPVYGGPFYSVSSNSSYDNDWKDLQWLNRLVTRNRTGEASAP